MSINERKHPQITETKLDLSPTQEQAFQQLRAKLGPDADVYTDYALFRFLKFNSWSVDAAAAHWLEYLKWRTENKIDDLTKTPPKDIDIINLVTPYAYHHYDKEGRPIYWEKTGKLKCSAAADQSIIAVADFVNSHIWGMEHIYELCHAKSLELGKRVDTFCSVLDMDGLGFGHRAVIFLLKECMDVDNKYYPERIGKLYVLNTPWIAPTLYNLVSPLLPAQIKERLYVVEGNPNEFLATKIDRALLPAEYGGECTCNGKKPSCVPEYDASEITARAKKVDGLDHEEVKYDFVKTLECDEKGGVFSWFFECEEGYDIDFSVAIVDPSKPDAPPVWAKPVSRCSSSKGSYESKTPARLIFKWDNNFSYFANKNIKYALGVMDPTELTASQQEA